MIQHVLLLSPIRFSHLCLTCSTPSYSYFKLHNTLLISLRYNNYFIIHSTFDNNTKLLEINLNVNRGMCTTFYSRFNDNLLLCVLLLMTAAS